MTHACDFHNTPHNVRKCPTTTTTPTRIIKVVCTRADAVQSAIFCPLVCAWRFSLIFASDSDVLGSKTNFPTSTHSHCKPACSTSHSIISTCTGEFTDASFFSVDEKIMEERRARPHTHTHIHTQNNRRQLCNVCAGARTSGLITFFKCLCLCGGVRRRHLHNSQRANWLSVERNTRIFEEILRCIHDTLYWCMPVAQKRLLR